MILIAKKCTSINKVHCNARGSAYLPLECDNVFLFRQGNWARFYSRAFQVLMKWPFSCDFFVWNDALY